MPGKGSRHFCTSAPPTGRVNESRGATMSLPSLDELLRRTDGRREPVSVAVAGAADGTVLEALRQARDRGWVRPVLVGAAAAIERLAAEQRIELRGWEVVDSAAPSVDAVRLI